MLHKNIAGNLVFALSRRVTTADIDLATNTFNHVVSADPNISRQFCSDDTMPHQRPLVMHSSKRKKCAGGKTNKR